MVPGYLGAATAFPRGGNWMDFNLNLVRYLVPGYQPAWRGGNWIDFNLNLFSTRKNVDLRRLRRISIEIDI